MKRVVLMGAVFVLCCGSANAESGFPLQIGVFPPVQLVPETMNVSGLRLNLPYSANDRVVGIDLGIASSAADMEALQVNLYNVVYGDLTGVQIGLLDRIGSGSGLQVGLLETVNTVYAGVQIGLINNAEEMTGLQIGLINRTEFLTGLQIGLVNVIEESALPFFPIVNLSF